MSPHNRDSLLKGALFSFMRVVYRNRYTRAEAVDGSLRSTGWETFYLLGFLD